jgi:hypothetical protein
MTCQAAGKLIYDVIILVYDANCPVVFICAALLVLVSGYNSTQCYESFPAFNIMHDYMRNT